MRNRTAEVSVVTATYNRASMIVRAVVSMQRQTFANWQHIIVDDGSTDDTASILTPYLRRDPRMIYLRRKSNQGAVSAMNFGIRRATSPFVAFLDSDDEFTRAHLQLRL